MHPPTTHPPVHILPTITRNEVLTISSRCPQADRFTRWCKAVDLELLAPRPKESADSSSNKGGEAAAASNATTEATLAADKDGSQTSPAAAAHSTEDPSTAVAHDTDSDSEDDDAPLPRVAIVEIGAGGNVTTVRLRSEQLLKRWNSHAECTLIRINPDLPLADNKTNSEK